MHEHDGEPVPGLPLELPEGERILWQGRSDASSLRTFTFHVRKLAVYFAALLALRLAFKLNEGVGFVDALSGSVVLAILAVVAVGLLTYYANRAAAASMFTITDRRIVIRCGVAVSVSMNLPYSVIDSAELRLHNDGSGDISIRTDRSARASYVLLWPMVKSFRWFDVRPLLRGISKAEAVAETLGGALADYAAGVGAGTGSPAPQPEVERRRRKWSLHPPLAGASALVVFAIVAVSAYQLSNRGVEREAMEPSVESIELWFDDQEDGSVTVINAANGIVVEVLQPGTNGFVRGTLRSLARERRASDIGEEIPFAVLRTVSGRILLHDPATGRVIDLRAFGTTNQDVFARFLNSTTNDRIVKGRAPQSEAADTGVAAVALTQQETRK